MTIQEPKTERDLFQFLDEQGSKWASLTYKKGVYHLRFRAGKNFQYAEGSTMDTLLENITTKIENVRKSA